MSFLDKVKAMFGGSQSATDAPAAADTHEHEGHDHGSHEGHDHGSHEGHDHSAEPTGSPGEPKQD